jgi:hypothetical protein
MSKPMIKVYRKWTEWETDADGNTIGDEPVTVKEEEQEFDCSIDDFDRSEGLTVVDEAVRILETRLYVDETSNYPWSPGSWYSACLGPDHSWGMGGADEDLTAHLEGFNIDEETAIFEDLKKRHPNWR